MTYEGPAADKFAAVLSDIGLAASEVGSRLRLEGTPPVLNSPHQIALAGGIALLAQGAAVSALWEQRGGRPQQVTVDARDPVFALNPFPWLRRNDHLAINLAAAREPGNGYFPTADGGHVFVTTPGARQRDRLLRLLGTPNDRAAVAAAIGKYDSAEIEDAFIREGLPGSLVRDAAEWRRLPHGIAVAAEPVIRVERIGDGDPEPLGPGTRPLDGIRVADLTHVVAGPTVSRYLAEQGADVLHLGPIHPKLIDHTGMTLETNMGKRSAIVDFDDDGAQVLTTLLRDADVFVQAWRPGMLRSRGFGPAEVAALRPGIIYVSVSCYGPAGPWADRAGYDPVALASTGVTADEARHDTFKNAPPGVLTDGYAGFLGAAAVASVLARRAVEGGSWHVSISLARLATWLQEFGQYPEGTPEGPPLGAPRTRRIESPFGTIDYVAPALRYSETTSYFDKPPVPVGASRPQWLPRHRALTGLSRRWDDGRVIDEYASWRPRPGLRPYAAGCTGYRQAGIAPAAHRGLPSPWLTMIITLDEPLVVSRHPDPRQPASAHDFLLGGLHTSPALITHQGRQSGLQLALTPLGARALLGVPAGELASIDVEASDVLGRLAAEVRERVLAAPDWAGRFAVLEHYLAERVRAAQDTELLRPEVSYAWDRLRQTGGAVSVAQLAAETGWSPRHLGEQFRAETGLSPKAGARVVRFDRARRRLQGRHAAGGTVRIAELAADCGYYDQAHLARDFRALAGCPPSVLLGEELRNVQALLAGHWE